MLQDTLKRIQARSATKLCRTLYANPYPFGMGMRIDKTGRRTSSLSSVPSRGRPVRSTRNRADSRKVENRNSLQPPKRTARLSQLRRMFPQASKKMLAQHLREMERDGLIVRTDLSGRLRHVEYSLSDSGGFAVLQLINTLTEWGSQYASLLPSQKLLAVFPDQ